MGLETEFGLMCASDSEGEPPLGVEATAAELLHPTLVAGGSTNSFLFDGARFYLDVGTHPECATTECRSVADLAANNHTGERLCASMAARADSRLASEGMGGRIHLFENNLDVTGNPFGRHENCLVRRRTGYRTRIAATLPYFVTRQIVAGTGCIRRAKDGAAAYCLSQHVGRMWDTISSVSTRSRPMINIRNEPRGDPELCRRMHVIVDDPDMCEATAALKVAVTQAVFAVLGDGGVLPHMELADPVLATRGTSVDLAGHARLELANGGWITPIEIQGHIREAVLWYFDAKGYVAGLNASTSYLLDSWGRVVKSVKSGDASAIAAEVGWAAKLSLLSGYVERAGVTLNDPRLTRLDLAYHDIAATGLRPSMEETGVLRTFVLPEAVQETMATPPPDTHVKLRGDFIGKARRRRLDYAVDWTNLRLLEVEGTCSVVLKDPFALVDERVDHLMEEMDRRAGSAPFAQLRPLPWPSPL